MEMPAPVHHSLPPKGTAYPVQAQGMLTPAPPACRDPAAVTVPSLRQWPVSFLKKAYLPFLRPPAGHIRPVSACIEEESRIRRFRSSQTPQGPESGAEGRGTKKNAADPARLKSQDRPFKGRFDLTL